MRSRRLALVLTLAIGLSGCGAITSWIDLIRQNPIAGIQDGLSGIGLAIETARSVFEVLAGQSSEVAAKRAEFERYVAGVATAVDLARASMHVISSATTGDIDRILASSFEALEKLYRFIVALRGQLPPERLSAPMPGDGARGDPPLSLSEYHQQCLQVIRHALPQARRQALANP